LDDIVPKGILYKIERVENDFRDKLDSLSRTGMIDGSLQDTASVSMRGDFDEVGSDRVVDELVVVRNELVETLLNDLHESA
jgi:hypothetical protein